MVKTRFWPDVAGSASSASAMPSVGLETTAVFCWAITSLPNVSERRTRLLRIVPFGSGFCTLPLTMIAPDPPTGSEPMTHWLFVPAAGAGLEERNVKPAGYVSVITTPSPLALAAALFA